MGREYLSVEKIAFGKTLRQEYTCFLRKGRPILEQWEIGNETGS